MASTSSASEKSQFELPSKLKIRSISRDEMNLAEFPLAVLSTRANSDLASKNGSIKTLEFNDTIRGKNGEVLARSWIITGADKFGLPTSSDDEVLLGLLKLTVDCGFTDRKVHFSRYELLKILRWSTEGRSYQRLQRALDRLSGVRIKAQNAFYDNESKSHSTKNFGIVDAYEIHDGRHNAFSQKVLDRVTGEKKASEKKKSQTLSEGDEQGSNAKLSYFIWSEALFKSYQVGFIKKFDLDFYLSLKSAVSKRLYRYLDKHFWYRSRVQVNLFTLCHEKIGISRNYQYASSLKQQLDPALLELQEHGFVGSAEYHGKGKETEVVIGAATKVPQVTQRDPANRRAQNFSGAQGDTGTRATGGRATGFDSSSGARVHGKNSQQHESDLHDRSHAEPRAESVIVEHEGRTISVERSDTGSQVAQLLSERGIKAQQIERLLRGKDEAALSRVLQIVKHVDTLVQKGQVRSQTAFLYRAIENHHSFVLPEEQPKQLSLLTQNKSIRASDQKQLFDKNNFAKSRSEPVQKIRERDEADSKLQSEYLVWRKKELLSIRREEVDADVLYTLESEVREALNKVKGSISESRLTQLIEHGVEEKIAKMFAVQSFEEWVREQRRRKS